MPKKIMILIEHENFVSKTLHSPIDIHGRVILVPFKNWRPSTSYSTRVKWTSHVLQVTKNTRQCISHCSFIFIGTCEKIEWLIAVCPLERFIVFVKNCLTIIFMKSTKYRLKKALDVISNDKCFEYLPPETYIILSVTWYFSYNIYEKWSRKSDIYHQWR